MFMKVVFMPNIFHHFLDGFVTKHVALLGRPNIRGQIGITVSAGRPGGGLIYGGGTIRGGGGIKKATKTVR